MTTAIIVGLVSILGALVLVWPAVRRAGPAAWPALLFWAAAIAAVALAAVLYQRWTAPPEPLFQPAPSPRQFPQRGVVT
jgi:hypothetical protein